MDAWTLARLAGHSSIKQSMIYVHTSDRALHAAIDRLGGDKTRDNDVLEKSADETRILTSTKT